ncbi:hypothetical protein K503DRAFT_805531 [Rhizopogon vinicolor AM-OR11-026]|uniref:Uncharacterized protein n=1 Tax=Rhizopogon vinicolor AM-OR11-026 TaxID=1314800 RepID=A0A1B7MHL0_9AGAM|nr:hypothetical protein K503DRAFT_805531 [Rhizopogon vinicolor AM-OR11-026]
MAASAERSLLKSYIPLSTAIYSYYIPKGATITPKIWEMCHDEAKYPNAPESNPEHFLNPNGTLTDDMVRDENDREIDIKPQWRSSSFAIPLQYRSAGCKHGYGGLGAFG